MMLGTVTAGKLADRTNQHILHAFALLLMGVTLVSASMCHTLVVFSIVIGVQGFFNGIHSVGKETTKRISSGYSGWGGGKNMKCMRQPSVDILFITYYDRAG